MLKRDMEYAMLDSLVEKCREKNIKNIYGYYYKTKKNSMVSGLYKQFGFIELYENEKGDSKWLLDISVYKNKNNVILVKEGKRQNE